MHTISKLVDLDSRAIQIPYMCDVTCDGHFAGGIEAVAGIAYGLQHINSAEPTRFAIRIRVEDKDLTCLLGHTINKAHTFGTLDASMASPTPVGSKHGTMEVKSEPIA